MPLVVQYGWTGGPRLQRVFDCGQEPNIRCFVEKSDLSGVMHTFAVSNAKLIVMKFFRSEMTTPPPFRIFSENSSILEKRGFP